MRAGEQGRWSAWRRQGEGGLWSWAGDGGVSSGLCYTWKNTRKHFWPLLQFESLKQEETEDLLGLLSAAH